MPELIVSWEGRSSSKTRFAIRRDSTPARSSSRELARSLGPQDGKLPAGEVALREAQLLADSGIPREAFDRFSNLTPGTRRPYLVWIDDLRITDVPEGIRLALTLPSGCYATVVLREFQKTS